MDNLNYKTCPLKRATAEDILVFHNVQINEEDMQALAERRQNGEMLAFAIYEEDGESYVEPAIGRCDRECCGWWDAEQNQCAAVTISKGVIGLHGRQ